MFKRKCSTCDHIHEVDGANKGPTVKMGHDCHGNPAVVCADEVACWNRETGNGWSAADELGPRTAYQRRRLHENARHAEFMETQRALERERRKANTRQFEDVPF